MKKRPPNTRPPNTVIHTFEPIYDSNSRILILGTMPSVKSREANFYYMNPQNLFWKVLSDLLKIPFPQGIGDKINMLISNGIAVWDVLKSCEIEGSLDSTIRSPISNDLSIIFNAAKIKAVFTNGTKATSLYNKYCKPNIAVDSIYLPSTSPANKKYFTYEKIYKEWSRILDYLE